MAVRIQSHALDRQKGQAPHGSGHACMTWTLAKARELGGGARALIVTRHRPAGRSSGRGGAAATGWHQEYDIQDCGRRLFVSHKMRRQSQTVEAQKTRRGAEGYIERQLKPLPINSAQARDHHPKTYLRPSSSRLRTTHPTTAFHVCLAHTPSSIGPEPTTYGRQGQSRIDGGPLTFLFGPTTSNPSVKPTRRNRFAQSPGIDGKARRVGQANVLYYNVNEAGRAIGMTADLSTRSLEATQSHAARISGRRRHDGSIIKSNQPTCSAFGPWSLT